MGVKEWLPAHDVAGSLWIMRGTVGVKEHLPILGHPCKKIQTSFSTISKEVPC